MFYFTKTPALLQMLYPKRIWRMPANDNKVYLTFDDGPHPEQTIFVLDTLQKFSMKATFFCIGKNVELYPDVYNRILLEGHKTGNHTQHHLNGWSGNDKGYIDDVKAAAAHVDSNLFRPPYGRLSAFREKVLRESAAGYRIIMWNVLSGDFDDKISLERCAENVLLNTTPGSIVVFHDSEKASTRMRFALPKLLQRIAENNWVTELL